MTVKERKMISSRSSRFFIFIFLVFIVSSFAFSAADPIEIILKAETATLSPGMLIVPDGKAINNYCIHGYPHNKKGWATFEVNIPKSDNYIIWGRVHSRDGYANSFFVQVDGKEVVVWDLLKRNYYIWEYVTKRGNGYTTTPDVAPMIYYLTAGRHIIKIGNREKETRLDELIVTNDLERVYDDHPSTWLSVVAPQMGDVIIPGSTCEIKWASRYISDKVNIDLSYDLGYTFDVPIVHGTENDGTYLWQVPDYFNRAKLVIRISDADGLPFDINRGYFAAVNPTDVSLTLLNPVAGDTLTAGSRYIIKWKEFAFNGKVTIQLSVDNGASWETIANNQNAAGENDWTVWESPSDSCRIKIMDAVDGDPFDISEPFAIVASPAVADGPASDDNIFSAIPTLFEIQRNYPNPFNPQTSIEYSVPEDGFINVSVYDLRGRLVDVLVDDHMDAGRHAVTWDATHHASGMYMTVMQAGTHRAVHKMTLMK